MTMSTSNPLFTQQGHQFLCSMAGCLLLAASAVYGDPCETTPRGRANGRKMMDAILGAARKAGYTQGDILATLLARNEPSRRVAEMAVAACDLIPGKEKERVMQEFAKGRQHDE